MMFVVDIKNITVKEKEKGKKGKIEKILTILFSSL
jgi:hypothetical protein